ncbi:HAD family hydrolase [Halobium salinum]|uniref:HAD family hydrolase n=1 Tax=Halobium salinum TaxID=1364940 RepID=A0ABD5PCK2_9EURY|nr:HAD family hydrolase [Halobium salinum]
MPTCYFDLDGTLVEYDAPFADVLSDAFAAVGVDADRTLLETYSEAFFDVLGDADDPFAAAIDRTDAGVDPAAFSDAMVRTEAEHTVVVDGADAVLDTLSGEWRLGVLTNGFGPAQRAKLETVGLTDRFESVVVSGEVGARKPEPAIYRAAEGRLAADSYVFVADDLERDVLPAVDCGWRGVLVGDDVNPSVPDGVETVRSLADVPTVL